MRRRSRKNTRKRGGMFEGLSSAATSALLPFGLLYAQKAFQKNRRVLSIKNIYRKTRRFK